MSADNLEQRVVELEDRIEELEALLGTDVESTQSTGAETEDRTHPKTVVEDIPDAHGDGVVIETVLRRLDEEGFDNPEAELDKLRRRGEIYNPSRSIVKVV